MVANTHPHLEDPAAPMDMHALSAAINARCEAQERVIEAARLADAAWNCEDNDALTVGMMTLHNALVALDGLPPAWQDETAKVRVEPPLGTWEGVIPEPDLPGDDE